MIERLHRTALFLAPLKWPAIVVFITSTAMFAWIILAQIEDDYWLIPSILGLLWSLAIYGLVMSFSTIPGSVNPEDGFFRRLMTRFYRLWFWVFGLIFVGIVVITIQLTSSMIGIWMRDF